MGACFPQGKLELINPKSSHHHGLGLGLRPALVSLIWTTACNAREFFYGFGSELHMGTHGWQGQAS